MSIIPAERKVVFSVGSVPSTLITSLMPSNYCVYYNFVIFLCNTISVAIVAIDWHGSAGSKTPRDTSSISSDEDALVHPEGRLQAKVLFISQV